MRLCASDTKTWDDPLPTASGPRDDRPRGPDAAGASCFRLRVAAQMSVLILLTRWASGKIFTRMLRPANAIHAEPGGTDEIADLARTVDRALRRLREAEARLGQADQRLQRTLEQQRDFASNASHELRTPLAALRMRLEEAKFYPDDVDLRELVDQALSDVDRLQAITTDLLLLVKVNSTAAGTAEEMDLAELVRAEAARRTGDTRPLLLQLEPDVRVDAVPTQLRRALNNLVDNAQRHARSAVRIRVRRVDAGDLAELAITDDGAGIAEGDRERIFLRFTRLDTARDRGRGGTGLGLAIAWEVAQSHRGTLHVEEPPGGGARFVLRLPIRRNR